MTALNELIFFDSKIFFTHLLEGIERAKRSIDLEFYIFSEDKLGKIILDALKVASARGVQVRIMVDGFGSPEWTKSDLEELFELGIEARIFHPLPWITSWPRVFQSITTLNQRNHRKVCIIDKKEAWLGGMNISESHLDWRDTGITIQGPEVSDLLHGFERAWNKSWSARRKQIRWKDFQRTVTFAHLVRLNHTLKVRRKTYRNLLKRIGRAKNRVWITNAYFVPPRRLIRSLRIASQHGADVKIIVPKQPDVLFIKWISSALYSGLLKAGVRIFEYIPSPLHAKTMIIDDWCTVGTTNLNHRSMIHDLEVDLVLRTQKSITSLNNQFQLDLNASVEMTREVWNQRPWKLRIVGQILLWFRYWI